jgi:hypothetical protein
MPARSHRTERRLQHAEQLLDALAAVKLKDLRRDVRALIERDDVQADADGWPTGHQAPARVALDPNEADDVTLTSVEGAAQARITGRISDPVHQQAVRAEKALAEIVRLLATVENAITASRMTTPAGQYQGDQPCQSHAHAKLTVPGEVYGDVGGRLPSQMYLCEACRQFVYKVDDRLPTVDELEHHARTGKWPKSARRAS